VVKEDWWKGSAAAMFYNGVNFSDADRLGLTWKRLKRRNKQKESANNKMLNATCRCCLLAAGADDLGNLCRRRTLQWENYYQNSVYFTKI